MLLALQFGSGLGFNLSWFVWGQRRSLGWPFPPGQGAQWEQEWEQEWGWQALGMGVYMVKHTFSSGLCPFGAEIPEENWAPCWWNLQDSPGIDQSQGCRDSTAIPTIPVFRF